MVYSQAPFAGPRKLLDYLGRYTHRVAISNHRILTCQDGQVRYRYRDRRDGDRLKTDVLPAEEFLHRFLQHVLPDRFLRIRHYGLLANCVKGQQLARCRQLLGARPPAADDQPHTAADWMRVLLGIDITRCPCCGATLYRQELRPSVASPDRGLPSCPPKQLPSLGHFLNRGPAMIPSVLPIAGIASHRHPTAKTLRACQGNPLLLRRLRRALALQTRDSRLATPLASTLSATPCLPAHACQPPSRRLIQSPREDRPERP